MEEELQTEVCPGTSGLFPALEERKEMRGQQCLRTKALVDQVELPERSFRNAFSVCLHTHPKAPQEATEADLELLLPHRLVPQV